MPNNKLPGLENEETNKKIFEAVGKYFNNYPASVKIEKYVYLDEEGKRVYYPEGIRLPHSFVKIKTTENAHEIFALANTECFEALLGEGSFGRVKVAQNERGDNYAIKIQSSETSDEDEIEIKKEITESEKSIMKKIGTLIGLAERQTKGDRKKLYIAMKLIKGDELYKKVTDTINPLNETQKLLLALESCYAIQKLHDLNIIHADIKAENFMADMHRNKILVEAIDFGFSMELGQNSSIKLGRLVGSADFMAPEIKSDQEYSFASDVYALGKMLKIDLILPEHLYEGMLEENPNYRPQLNVIILRLIAELEKKLVTTPVAKEQIDNNLQKRIVHMPSWEEINENVKSIEQKFIDLDFLFLLEEHIDHNREDPGSDYMYIDNTENAEDIEELATLINECITAEGTEKIILDQDSNSWKINKNTYQFLKEAQGTYIKPYTSDDFAAQVSYEQLYGAIGSFDEHLTQEENAPTSYQELNDALEIIREEITINRKKIIDKTGKDDKLNWFKVGEAYLPEDSFKIVRTVLGENADTELTWITNEDSWLITDDGLEILELELDKLNIPNQEEPVYTEPVPDNQPELDVIENEYLEEKYEAFNTAMKNLRKEIALHIIKNEDKLFTIGEKNVTEENFKIIKNFLGYQAKEVLKENGSECSISDAGLEILEGELEILKPQNINPKYPEFSNEDIDQPSESKSMPTLEEYTNANKVEPKIKPKIEGDVQHALKEIKIIEQMQKRIEDERALEDLMFREEMDRLFHERLHSKSPDKSDFAKKIGVTDEPELQKVQHEPITDITLTEKIKPTVEQEPQIVLPIPIEEFTLQTKTGAIHPESTQEPEQPMEQLTEPMQKVPQTPPTPVKKAPEIPSGLKELVHETPLSESKKSLSEIPDKPTQIPEKPVKQLTEPMKEVPQTPPAPVITPEIPIKINQLSALERIQAKDLQATLSTTYEKLRGEYKDLERFKSSSVKDSFERLPKKLGRKVFGKDKIRDRQMKEIADKFKAIKDTLDKEPISNKESLQYYTSLTMATLTNTVIQIELENKQAFGRNWYKSTLSELCANKIDILKPTFNAVELGALKLYSPETYSNYNKEQLEKAAAEVKKFIGTITGFSTFKAKPPEAIVHDYPNKSKLKKTEKVPPHVTKEHAKKNKP